MAALGDTFTKTLENTQYTFTCISTNPELWFCPTPLCASRLITNQETSPYASKINNIIYYTVNDYNAIVGLENFIFTSFGTAYYSTVMFDEDTFDNKSYRNKNLTFLNSFNKTVISKFLKDDQIYFKLTFPANTYNYSINIQPLGFYQSNSSFIYNKNQSVFFSIFDFREYTTASKDILCQTLQFRCLSTTLLYAQHESYMKNSAYTNAALQVKLPIYLMYYPSVNQNQNRLFEIFNICTYSTYQFQGYDYGKITLSSTNHVNRIVLFTTLMDQSLARSVVVDTFNQEKSSMKIYGTTYTHITGKFHFTYLESPIYKCIRGVITGTSSDKRNITILFFNQV